MNLYVTLRTANAARTPAWPDLRPFIEFWRLGATNTLLKTADMASYLPGVQEGTFRYNEFLGPLYSQTVRHAVIIRFTDQDGVPRLVAGSFELVGGGSQAGTIISMTAVARPDARYLLTSTDAGTISRRKNPR